MQWWRNDRGGGVARIQQFEASRQIYLTSTQHNHTTISPRFHLVFTYISTRFHLVFTSNSHQHLPGFTSCSAYPYPGITSKQPSNTPPASHLRPNQGSKNLNNLHSSSSNALPVRPFKRQTPMHARSIARIQTEKSHQINRPLSLLSTPSILPFP